MKWKQRIVALAMAMILVGGAATTISMMPETSITAEAASAKTKAVNAYAKYLKKYEAPTAVARENAVFQIAYIDNDSVPELLVCTGDSHMSNWQIYTYYKV